MFASARRLLDSTTRNDRFPPNCDDRGDRRRSTHSSRSGSLPECPLRRCNEHRLNDYVGRWAAEDEYEVPALWSNEGDRPTPVRGMTDGLMAHTSLDR